MGGVCCSIIDGNELRYSSVIISEEETRLNELMFSTFWRLSSVCATLNFERDKVVDIGTNCSDFSFEVGVGSFGYAGLSESCGDCLIC